MRWPWFLCAAHIAFIGLMSIRALLLGRLNWPALGWIECVIASIVIVGLLRQSRLMAKIWIGYATLAILFQPIGIWVISRTQHFTETWMFWQGLRVVPYGIDIVLLIIALRAHAFQSAAGGRHEGGHVGDE